MTTWACIRGKMGTTEYYLLKLKAGALINSVGYASQMVEWDDMDIDEKIQRELDDKRVVNEIVPYLIQDEDRFFGSFIVDVYRGWEDIAFESLSSISKVPKAYENKMEDIGFVTIPDNQSLIALDGQHRLLSLNVAIKGKNGLPASSKLSDEVINKLKPHPDLVEEELTVILIPHTDTMKVRKIFNKINRYAKGTSRGDNIIMDEDDIYAVISRRIMKAGEPLAPKNKQDLVNWTSNTLSVRSKNLTTISAVYSITEEIIGKYDKNLLPSNDIVEEKYEEVSEFWSCFLEGMDDFTTYVKIIEGVEKNKDIPTLRAESLLLKPVTQMAISIAYKLCLREGITLSAFIEKLNHISWKYESELWQSIIVIKGTTKIITNKQAITYAGRLIAYLICGNQYSDSKKKR